MAVNRESCRRNRRAPSTIACDRSAPVRTGIALSIEFNRAARGLDHYSLPWEGLFSVIRGFAFGAGLYRILGFGFAIAFCHSYHNRPSIRLFSRHASCHRLCRVSSSAAYASSTVGFMATALVCSAFIRQVDHTWSFAIRVGLVTGIVTGVGTKLNPYIEYYADNLPERRLGVFGIGLILCGFAMQSLQYWLALFDVHLT